MENVLLRESTDPAPRVVAYGAVHVRAASVFLDLTAALRASVNGYSHSLHGSSHLTLLVPLAARAAVRGLLAFATRHFFTLGAFYLLSVSLANLRKHLLAIGGGAKE